MYTRFGRPLCIYKWKSHTDAFAVTADQTRAIGASFSRNMQLEFIRDWQRSTQSEFGTRGRNILDNAIHGRHAIVEDDLRAPKGLRTFTPSQIRHVFPAGHVTAGNHKLIL